MGLEQRKSELVQALAEIAQAKKLRIGAAESLTGGALCSALAAAPGAGDWFHGCVVAYSPRVKQDVLGVAPGPVVTERCAGEMATGAARVLAVDAAVSTTGVGGPGEEEGEPPGTVFIGVVVDGTATCERVDLDGSPAEIVEMATQEALRVLSAAIRD